MTFDDLHSLYAYNAWANARFFEAIDGLDETRRTAPLESSFRSVIDTLGHIVGAEWIWLSRWQGTSPAGFPEGLQAPTLEDLRSRLTKVESDRAAFLSTLTEEALQRPLAYTLLNGTASSTRLLDLLLHVVNHSTYHRGQLTTLLRQVGGTPPATDFVVYKRQNPA
jgi:uncharacterized damage-inducible protein DinB